MSPRRHRLISAFLRLRHRSLRHMLDHEAIVKRERLLELERSGRLQLALGDSVAPTPSCPSSPEAESVSPFHSTPRNSHVSPWERSAKMASRRRIGDGAAVRIARLCSLACPLEEDQERQRQRACDPLQTPTSSLHPVTRGSSVVFHAVRPREEISEEGKPRNSRRGPSAVLSAICSRLNLVWRRAGGERRAPRLHAARAISSAESRASSAPHDVNHARKGPGADQGIETGKVEAIETIEGRVGAGEGGCAAGQRRAREGRKRLGKVVRPAKDKWHIHAIRA